MRRPIVNDPFEWKPVSDDLDDDCYCHWNGLMCHAECMSDISIHDVDNIEPPSAGSHWWAAIYEKSDENRVELWSTNWLGGYYIGGPQTRALCQWVMLSIIQERRLAEQIELNRLLAVRLQACSEVLGRRAEVCRCGLSIDMERDRKVNS